MFENLLAKSSTDTSKAETIWEHTNELLIRYVKLKALYPDVLSEKEWDLLYKACYYHDLGKANTKFQNKLHKKEEQREDEYTELSEVPHGYLSCAFLPIDELLEEITEKELRALMRAIYYHHERGEEQTNVSDIIIENDLPQYIPLLQKQGFDIPSGVDMDYGEFVEKDHMSNDELYLFVKLKGLLNKLDFAASAHIEAEIPHMNLITKLDYYLKLGGHKRNELQEYLVKYQHKNHVIIASTGIGKTEAALYWIGDSKGIFTLPLKVSINAIYMRLTKGINYEPVGLLHSDTISEYAKLSEDNQFNIALLAQTRQLSYPLTICTLDQIIDFVALYPGFEMKLAVLSYSKLVIDEIQMYSPSFAAFIVLGLKHIVNVGGQFTIMTATFPPLISEAMKGLDIPFKQRKTPFLKLDDSGEVIVRHFMEICKKDIQIDDVIQEGINKKVLIIVNTVSKAQALFQQFKNGGIHANVLHSRFIHSDRRRKEDEIERIGKLTCSDTGIWITTQVVEASIDIDFDVLFTELSEASGLFQRMGRVYRNRIHNSATPNVFVYTGDPLPSGISATSKKSVIDYAIFEKSKEVLLNYNNQYISEKDKMDIVNLIYTGENLAGSNYLDEFNNTIRSYSNLLPFEMDNKPVLRDIQNENIIPASVYQLNESAILDLQEILNSRSDWRDKVKALTELKKYVVAIPTWAFKKAGKSNLIGLYVQAGKYQTYAMVKYKYTQEEGLIYDIDTDQMFM